MPPFEWNHIIQKAFVKNFARNGKVTYVIYGTEEKGEFDINSLPCEQPIVEKNFYPEDIEKEMGVLENEGIQVVRKIIKGSQIPFSEIELSRKEEMILRLYYLLTLFRTNASRRNIQEKNGDYAFNKYVENQSISPKDLHVYNMRRLIDEFNHCKKANFKSYKSTAIIQFLA